MVLLQFSFLLLCAFWSVKTEEFTLTILHVNDVHARFEQTNVYSGRCTAADEGNNRCYGGFARIHTAVKELRESLPNVVFLAGGDYFQGTVWYTVHKYKAMAHFLNILNHDAMSLGNHEFDDGVENLVHFLDSTKFSVLASNIDDTHEPDMKGKYSPSVVVERQGRKVGIIGYLTTETLMISNSGRLQITDEVTAVRSEARRLKSEGVDIIIAVGHAGFRKDVELAESVEEVDVVVGGHTNTFLYSGEDPSTEVSVDSYPSVVVQPSGKKVPVVQAYAFGKYLGRLDVTFDSDGDAVNWTGNPILLDNSIKQDPDVLAELVPWRNEINAVIEQEIGKTYVFLDGDRRSCRMRECNLGNLEADAIIHLNTKFPDDMEWARTSLAIVNAGGIRSSIDERASNGSITMEDILTVAPFQNTIDIVELKGVHIKEMFEHSIASYDAAALDPPGGFLQVSGFVVAYDVSKPPQKRVSRLQARCVACRVPVMEDVKDNTVYKIAMPSFIANGGDGYSVIRDNKIQHHLTGLLDTDVYSQYVQMLTPIYQGEENRILFVDNSGTCNVSDEEFPVIKLNVPLDPSSSNKNDDTRVGPTHNPYSMTAHGLLAEKMHRYNKYYWKHYGQNMSTDGYLKEELQQANKELQEKIKQIWIKALIAADKNGGNHVVSDKIEYVPPQPFFIKRIISGQNNLNNHIPIENISLTNRQNRWRKLEPELEVFNLKV